MFDAFREWAAYWGVPEVALQDLAGRLTQQTMPDSLGADTPESVVAKRVRLEAAQKGLVLWRNNVGAAKDEHGNFFRYGLANDSQKMNKRVKSHDLVGIRPVVIQPHHVGQKIGQFVCRETKAAGWTYSGTEREQAQLNFATLVQSMGGDAGFATGEGTL